MYILSTMSGGSPRPQINKETNERYCLGCEVWYVQTSDYWYTLHGRVRSNYCKFCYREKHPSTPATTETSRVLLRPYTFKHEEQRQDTHDFLMNLGWRWQESGKRWVKPGVVNEDGTWVRMPEDVEKVGAHELTMEERQVIKSQWEASGHDYDYFQSEYNITKNRLESCLRSLGPKKRKKHKPHKRKEGKLRDWKGDIVYRKDWSIPYIPNMSPDERQRMIKMVLSGSTHFEVAKHFNRTTATVGYQMRKYYGRKT